MDYQDKGKNEIKFDSFYHYSLVNYSSTLAEIGADFRTYMDVIQRAM